jgi:hypothetical protein
MKFATSFSLTSLFLIIACKPSNPETVLGIKLGKLRNSQVQELKNSGQIKTNGDINYIYYAEDLLADIYVYSINDAEGNRIVNSVLLQFYNPKAEFPSGTKDKFIDPMLKDPIIKMYQNKYGKGEVRTAGGSEYYTWEKGDMIIELNFNAYAIPFGEKLPWYNPVSARYKYTKNIEEKLEKNANSADKKI